MILYTCKIDNKKRVVRKAFSQRQLLYTLLKIINSECSFPAAKCHIINEKSSLLGRICGVEKESLKFLDDSYLLSALPHYYYPLRKFFTPFKTKRVPTYVEHPRRVVSAYEHFASF